jgi:hypothetical protein
LRNLLRRASVTALALAGLALGPALAQSQSGNVFGTVSDDKGEPLPGVTLTLSGGGAPSIQVSDAQGQFRFVGIYPGTYKLEGSLEGFSPVVYPSLIVNLNRNTTIELTLNAAVEETITITAESPLLDARKISTGATIDKSELEKIPTARDPWVILQTTPGVMVDRVNVGGNESGQQSGYVGNGDDGTNNTWSIDGVEITDVGAIGSSTSYYDFDAFEEMQVTTGGSDATSRTGGVGMNLVTKRGTNEWRGTGRYLVSYESWQSDFNADAGDFGKDFDGAGGAAAQSTFKQGNRIVSVEDYGAEIGGPILRDKLWIWGSYGKNDIQLLTVSDFPDNTLLESYNVKFNWQVAQNNSATLFYFKNNKIKQGRNAGPTRPPETAWNQSDLDSDTDVFAFLDKRPDVMKIEDTHIFGSNFFLTGAFSENAGGFQLVPAGGISFTQPNAVLDERFVWHNTFLNYSSERPQDQYKADGSYFFSTGTLNHELKFGVGYREATVRSNSFWPGFGPTLNYYVPNYGYAYNVVALARESVLNYEVEYTNAYVQDTLTAGNLTANVGLRYDLQDSRNLPGQFRANPAFPDILPAVAYAGEENNFEWTTLAPRLGLTYALGEEKKTLLRASYSRFAEQLGGPTASYPNPGYPASYVYWFYDDKNGNGNADAGELVPDGFFYNNVSYNPAEPGKLVQSFATDPGLDAPISDELVLGVEHALRPEFVVGATLTWRTESDLFEDERLVFDGDAFDPANLGSIGRVHRASDYVVQRTLTGTLPDGSTYSVPVYTLRDGVTTRGGTLRTNGDREREYLGVSLTANKRLSNNWMLRGNLTWNDWTWKVPTSELDGDLTTPFGGGFDGDRVLVCSGAGSGAKAGVCISSSWSYSLSGMYQIAPDRPWGFNVAASLNGREGYSNPYWERVGTNAAGVPTRFVNVTGRPDDLKNEDLHILDLRLEKELKFDRFGLTLDADVFNVTNAGTVLQRNLRLRAGNSDHVQEVVSPRIYRLGAKLTFN